MSYNYHYDCVCGCAGVGGQYDWFFTRRVFVDREIQARRGLSGSDTSEQSPVPSYIDDGPDIPPVRSVAWCCVPHVDEEVVYTFLGDAVQCVNEGGLDDLDKNVPHGIAWETSSDDIMPPMTLRDVPPTPAEALVDCDGNDHRYQPDPAEDVGWFPVGNYFVNSVPMPDVTTFSVLAWGYEEGLFGLFNSDSAEDVVYEFSASGVAVAMWGKRRWQAGVPHIPARSMAGFELPNRTISEHPSMYEVFASGEIGGTGVAYENVKQRADFANEGTEWKPRVAVPLQGDKAIGYAPALWEFFDTPERSLDPPEHVAGNDYWSKGGQTVASQQASHTAGIYYGSIVESPGTAKGFQNFDPFTIYSAPTQFLHGDKEMTIIEKTVVVDRLYYDRVWQRKGADPGGAVNLLGEEPARYKAPSGALSSGLVSGNQLFGSGSEPGGPKDPNIIYRVQEADSNGETPIVTFIEWELNSVGYSGPVPVSDVNSSPFGPTVIFPVENTWDYTKRAYVNVGPIVVEQEQVTREDWFRSPRALKQTEASQGGTQRFAFFQSLWDGVSEVQRDKWRLRMVDATGSDLGSVDSIDRRHGFNSFSPTIIDSSNRFITVTNFPMHLRNAFVQSTASKFLVPGADITEVINGSIALPLDGSLTQDTHLLSRYLAIELNISGRALRDLRIEITLGGVTVVLCDRDGGHIDAGAISLTFAEEGEKSITDAGQEDHPYSEDGTAWRPRESLAGLEGEDLSGDFTITIFDYVADAEGVEELGRLSGVVIRRQGVHRDWYLSHTPVDGEHVRVPISDSSVWRLGLTGIDRQMVQHMDRMPYCTPLSHAYDYTKPPPAGP